MVAMEAAAHGVPTVAYAVGGVPDAVLDGTSGVLVQPGDEVGFAEAVDRTLSVGFVRESVRGWAEQFDWHLFGDAIERELSIAVVGGHDGRRSEERRVGEECVSQCRYRWEPYHSKKQKKP